MLQQLHGSAITAPRPPPWRAPRALRLLLLHHASPRLVALADALIEAGYRLSAAAFPEEARDAIDGVDPPDVLLTSVGGGRPMPGMVFARECLAVAPGLRVLYLTPLPWPAAVPLVGGEQLLRVPFTAAELAATLRALAPGYGSSDTGTSTSRPLVWHRGVL